MSELKVLLLLIYPIILASCNCRAASTESSTIFKKSSCVRECQNVQENKKNNPRNDKKLLSFFVSIPPVSLAERKLIYRQSLFATDSKKSSTCFMVANPLRGPPLFS